MLVEGQEVWEKWMGQVVEDAKCRRRAKGQWKAMEQAAMRSGGREWKGTRCMTGVE